MKILKICKQYRIPVTYKITKINRTFYDYEYISNLDYFIGVAPPLIEVEDYYIAKKFMYWWFFIKEDKYVKRFNTLDEAIKYITSRNKGRLVNLIRN